MYAHLTALGAVNIAQGHSRKILLTNNIALTGTITISDEIGTAGTPVVAVITNPTAGSQYEYWDMKNGVTVNPSATCDITISVSSGQGGNQ